MEYLEPYKQYLGRRLALDMGQLIQEIAHDTEHSPSAAAFVQCFEGLGITAPKDHHRAPTTLETIKRIDMYSFIFRTCIIEWAERKGYMGRQDNLKVSTLITLLKGGSSKLFTEIERSALHEITSLTPSDKQLTREETTNHLPALLMMSLGHTIQADAKARAPENGIDPALIPEMIDATFCQLCQDIRANKKPPRQGQDAIGELTFHASATLRQMYYGIPFAKLRETMPQIVSFIDATTPYGGSLTSAGRVDQMQQRLVTVFGEAGFSEEEVMRVSKSDAYKREFRRFRQLEDSQPEAAWKNQRKAIERLTITRLARRLIGGVADGDIRWSTILALDWTYNGYPGPLQERAKDIDQPLRKLWRRVDASERSERRAKGSEELGRLALLEGYASAWQGAEVLERNDADLGAQYVVAVFPEVLPDGRVIQHAIADHPVAADNPADGRHALYAWRGENGMNAAGEIVRTWEEVFSSPNRTEARRLGAIRILHSDGYERRALEYLTDPPKDLAKKHMHRTRPREE